jgi:hypothetical protein
MPCLPLLIFSWYLLEQVSSNFEINFLEKKYKKANMYYPGTSFKKYDYLFHNFKTLALCEPVSICSYYGFCYHIH